MRQDSEADISAEALQAQREWHDILTVLKVKKKKKKKTKAKTTSQQGIIK